MDYVIYKDFWGQTSFIYHIHPCNCMLEVIPTYQIYNISVNNTSINKKNKSKD